MAAATEIKAIWVDPTGGAGSTPILKEQASTNRLSDTVSFRDYESTEDSPQGRAILMGDSAQNPNLLDDAATNTKLLFMQPGLPAGKLALFGQKGDNDVGSNDLEQLRSLAMVTGLNDERSQGASRLGHLDRWLLGDGQISVGDGDPTPIVAPHTWRGAWAASAYATGTITFGGQPNNADTLVINDGTTTITYNFDGGTTVADDANNQNVVIGGSANATCTALHAKITTPVNTTINITSVDNTGSLSLTHDQYSDGSVPRDTNQAIDSSNATNVTDAGMTGGKRTYVSGDVVSNTHSGVEKGYVCIVAHDATAGVDQPGNGSSTEAYWRGPNTAGGDAGESPFIGMALRAGANVVFTRHDDHLPPWTEVSASVTGGGGGTLLTGSNIGGGAGVHSSSSTSTDLKLRTHVAVSGETTVDVAGDTIEHGLPTALMNHFNNVGIDHTQLHAANADTGLAGVTAAEIVTHMGGTGARLHDKGTYFCRDWTWETPVAGQSFLLFHTEKAILVGSIEAQVVGLGAQVEIQVYHDIAVNGTATTTNKVLATNPQPVSVNSPQWPTSLTSFSVAAIPAGSMVWITVPVVSGTVDQFFFQMQWTQS
ncbi:MAG: hypothetical protein OSB57_01810 [Planctomycetota bacterium]|nr:hypothetical protein [Planctomycetota bacterium]